MHWFSFYVLEHDPRDKIVANNRIAPQENGSDLYRGLDPPGPPCGNYACFHTMFRCAAGRAYKLCPVTDQIIRVHWCIGFTRTIRIAADHDDRKPYA